MLGFYKFDPIKETKRAWDVVSDPKVIKNLILLKLGKHPLYLKYTYPPAEFTPANEKNDGLEFYFNPSLELSNKMILYLFMKKQLEFHFEFQELLSPGCAILRPTILHVSKVERKEPRFSVKGDEVVASNFRVSKNRITANNIQFQITSRIIFPQIEEAAKKTMGDIRILISNSEELPDVIKQKEINQPEIIQTNSQHLFVFPIVTYAKNKFIPLAYILYPLQKLPNEEEKSRIMIELERIANETFEKILEVNTTLIKTKQRILNISEGGLAIEITDPELIKLIPYQESITFDLIFKLVAPLRMQGEVKYIHKIKKEGDPTLIMGIEFTGLGYTEFRKSNIEILRNLLKKLTPI